MDNRNKNEKKKTLSPSSLSLSGEEETGNYYCPVDENNNPLKEKKKYFGPGKSAPKGWVMCD